MKKFVIAIEETVVGEFEVIAETENEAKEIAHKKYKNREFMLEPGECQHAQMAVVMPYRDKLEWIEI